MKEEKKIGWEEKSVKDKRIGREQFEFALNKQDILGGKRQNLPGGDGGETAK